MIFVTVGAQMPFDRLIRTVDQWAGLNGREDVFAQVGETGYRPQYMRWVDFLAPEEFKQHYEAASVVVAHAGTGSIITALQFGKPVLVMPRRAALRETRNDHQVATSERFQHFDAVEVAWDEQELLQKLQRIDELRGAARIRSHASQELIGAIHDFIARC